MTTRRPLVDRRAKVLQLVLQLDFGGAESMVVLQALHLDRSKFDVHVWSLDRGGGNVARLQAAGVPVSVLDKGLGFSGTFLRHFRSLLREQQFDLIHAHNPTPARWAALGALGLRPKPVLVRTEHTFHEDGRVGHAIDHLVTGAFFAKDIGVCESVTRRHQAVDPVWRSKYLTVFNAIEIDGVVPGGRPARESLGLAVEERAVVNLGNLRPAKAQLDLVAAFAEVAARHPDTVLVIIGEGPLRPQLSDEARRLGIERRVRLIGHRADASALLVGADVVVQSSTREGLPVSLLEAARAKRPIVATDVGGTREFVIDGETGWLVPPGNREALAGAIDAALSDPARSRQLAENALQRLVTFHDVRVVSRDVERLYGDLLRERGFRAS